MSDSHARALKLLIPVDLGPNQALIDRVEGDILDVTQASAEDLLKEMFPDTTEKMITDWERICGYIPGPADTLERRRGKVFWKLQQGLKFGKDYYKDLANTFGYDLQIIPLIPTMVGWARAGDCLLPKEAVYGWWLKFFDKEVSGFSGGGKILERTLPFPDLVRFFNIIKPAHRFFLYDGSLTAWGQGESGPLS